MTKDSREFVVVPAYRQKTSEYDNPPFQKKTISTCSAPKYAAGRWRRMRIRPEVEAKVCVCLYIMILHVLYMFISSFIFLLIHCSFPGIQTGTLYPFQSTTYDSETPASDMSYADWDALSSPLPARRRRLPLTRPTLQRTRHERGPPEYTTRASDRPSYP